MNVNDKEEIPLILKKIEAIQRHIRLVQEACDILGTRLVERGEIKFGIQIIAAGYLHDNSKFTNYVQWNYLFQDEDKEMLKMAILDHQSTNSHHPEFWGTIDEMPRLELALLVTDLYSRSAEFGTSLSDYLKE